MCMRRYHRFVTLFPDSGRWKHIYCFKNFRTDNLGQTVPYILADIMLMHWN
jgi:hypothetical protein